MAYSNDIFISYAHEDAAWARKLEADLRDPQYPRLHIFRDETRLQAGNVWRTELLKNLVESQHLVVVWSDKAKQSAWVNAEIANFQANVGSATDRKLLCLLLQGTNPAYDPIQSFERENVIIMTLTPFALPPMQAALRDLVRNALAPMFNFYYEPPVPLTRRLPLCGLNLCDNDDMRRIVQFRIGHHPHVGALQDRHAAISVGRGSSL